MDQPDTHDQPFALRPALLLDYAAKNNVPRVEEENMHDSVSLLYVACVTVLDMTESDKSLKQLIMSVETQRSAKVS